MHELKLANRGYFKKRHLDPLLAGGVLRMTHPNQPAQVQRRLREQLGERDTVARAARRILRLFVDWGVLLETGRPGLYRNAPKRPVNDPNLAVWAARAVLAAQRQQPQPVGPYCAGPSYSRLKSLCRPPEISKPATPSRSRASDRAAAITAAALFEAELEKAIGQMLARHNSEVAKRIDCGKSVFKGQNPLSNLSAKIAFGWALGLYDAAERDRLRIAGQIRNKFAHAATPISFSDDVVAKKCHQLAGATAAGEPLRKTYLEYLKQLEGRIHEVVTSIEGVSGP